MDGHPRVGSQPFVQLVAADVDGHHLHGAGLQHAVGEPAGGGAGVDDPPSRDVHIETLQCGRQLLAAPRDEPRALADQLDRFARVDLACRLLRHGSADQHPPGPDQLLGPAAGVGQLAAHELGVETSTAAHCSCWDDRQGACVTDISTEISGHWLSRLARS